MHHIVPSPVRSRHAATCCPSKSSMKSEGFNALTGDSLLEGRLDCFLSRIGQNFKEVGSLLLERPLVFFARNFCGQSLKFNEGRSRFAVFFSYLSDLAVWVTCTLLGSQWYEGTQPPINLEDASVAVTRC